MKLAADPPSVSLAEVLEMALPSGSRVLAGVDLEHRRVSWARLLRSRPGGPSHIESGELLILPPGVVDARSDPRLIARVLSELIEVGAAAFVVSDDWGGPFSAAFSELDCSVLGVPAKSSLQEVERSIVGLILDRDAQIRRRAEEIYNRLLTTMLANAGLEALVAAIAETTQRSVAVFDDYRSLQACSDESLDIQRAMTEAVQRAPEDSGERRSSALVHVGLDPEEARGSGLLCPLQIGEAPAGWLLIADRVGGVSELDTLVAARAADLVALELAKQRAVTEATRRWHGEFLADLLEGNFPSEDAVLARARQLGYDLIREHVVVVFAPDPPDGSAGWADAQRSLSRFRRRFAELVRLHVPRLQAQALFLERDDSVTVLLPISKRLELFELRELVEPIRVALSESLNGAVSAGISRALERPTAVQQAEQDALVALSAAQRLLRGARTVHFDDLGVDRLLVPLLGHPELERFTLDILGGLLEYDELHRAELVKTVGAFLSCNGNHVRAAQELHLHRNTLLYRLDRAREILGRDLDDSDTRLSLMVALRIRHTLKPSNLERSGRSRRGSSKRRRVS